MKTKVKKFITMVVVFFVIISLGEMKTFAIHSGTESDPFPIKDMTDFYKTFQCMKVNKNWSNNKHFSLQCDMKIEGGHSLAQSKEEYCFNGIFHGNGHTITVLGNYSIFGYIGKNAVIENLTIAGNGYFAYDNKGTIKNCKLTGTTLSVVNNNYGIIQDCKVNGNFSYGIASSNHGTITRCLVEGKLSNSGLVYNNEATGKISNCRVRAAINYSGYSFQGGLIYDNKGLVEDCTANVSCIFTDNKITYGSNFYYLIYSNGTQKEALARRCVVGEDSKGAYMEQMFGSIGNAEECGYEGWDQEDHCSVK